MKKFLLVLFLAGCSVQAANKTLDAGVENTKSSIYVENKMKYVYAKYYPVCVQHCYNYTRSFECPDKCSNDFKQIKKTLIMSVRDNKEDDFDAVMEGWYGSAD